ncbi:Gfo/Idh/MocA family oxidoreductase [Oscillospiraceae bacterium OttesenSCG-928-F05]|nr:Gfo/Idh/MocA family oxidoreductase [Oscillospiraceae bacterium OttesenSCG-928-F05]
MGKIRWGIMGPGNIVNRWMNGLRQVADAEVTAIAGRTKENVDAMADKYSIPTRYYSYEDLAKSDKVDICYIAVPHTAHKDLAMLAMKNGKHVLVEKPISVNAEDVQAMIDCARENNVFMMEAVWTRFFPLALKVQQMISDGVIGDVRTVSASFGYRTNIALKERRTLNPALAGGGLLDVGVYPLHFADMIYDRAPAELTGYAAIDSDEAHIQVDEQAVYISKYDNGALAMMGTGVCTSMIDTAVIYGTGGMIILPVFWKPTKLELRIGRDAPTFEEFDVPQPNPDYVDEGFQYEILHIHECLAKGLKESPIMTMEKSLQIIKQCDTLRAQWNLVYPFEK